MEETTYFWPGLEQDAAPTSALLGDNNTFFFGLTPDSSPHSQVNKDPGSDLSAPSSTTVDLDDSLLTVFHDDDTEVQAQAHFIPSVPAPVEGTPHGLEPTTLAPLQTLLNVDPPVGKTKPGSRQRVSSSQWEEKRPIIYKLYIEQQMTLRDTMNTLNHEYGFRPCEKAYKAQLKEWGIRKNLNKREIAFIAKKHTTRKGGKDVAFLFKGEKIPRARIQRYKKGKAPGSKSSAESVPSQIEVQDDR